MKKIVLGLGIMVMALVLITQTASAAAKEYAPGETAVVKAGAYTDLVSADGAKVSGLSVTLTPGEHTIVMKPSYPTDNMYYTMGGYYLYSNVDGSVTFNAEPGHEYVAYADTSAGPAKEDNMGTGFSWVGYIKDKTANQRVAKTETLPLEAFPRLPGGGGGVFTSR